MRRVVVTGLGLVTPLGCGVDANWRRLTAGESGLKRIDRFNVEDLPSKVAAQLPEGATADGLWNADDWVEKRDQRKIDPFITYGIAAAQQAVDDSGWKPDDEEARCRTGVMIGSGIGGLNTIAETALVLAEKGPRRVSPFFIPAALINLGIAGFAAARALSTGYNDEPQRASRPWDVGRDGFVMGEGAGIVVLEEYEHAKARGAKIYAEVKGYGLSGDAHHITAPAENGDGGFRAMTAALKRADFSVSDIDYINAHGTSTPLGDEIELGAVKRLFGKHAYELAMSSTKSAIGHLLGAAGAVEAIFSILAIRDGILPPTLNLENPSEGCDINLVAKVAQKRRVRAVLSNSFGFGGTNASLILAEV